MTQTYAQRVAKRPAYATFKNRKKTIRQRRARGTITDTEAATLLREARDAYYADPASPQRPPSTPTVAETWCEANPDHPAAQDAERGRCSPECLAAQWVNCWCHCEGRNHGLANGPQGRSIRAHRHVRTWVDDAMRGVRKLATHRSNRGEITAATRMAVVAAAEAEIIRLGRPLRNHRRFIDEWIANEETT